MPRKSMGKTATIKQRTLYIYLPSQSTVESWKKQAEEANVSISKFVIDRVEDSIKREESQTGRSVGATRVELLKQIQELKDQVSSLRQEKSMLKKLSDSLDRELKRYRAKPFTDEKHEGVRDYDKKLLQLLKESKGQSLSSEELLSELEIEPSETDLVKAVNSQLTSLQAYGLVQYSGRGWRWTG